MKHSNFEHGNTVPSKMINPMIWNTVLESVNVGQSQSTGLSVTSGSGLQTGSSRNFRAKFLLALGAASVLVTATPLASYAEVVAMNQEWNFFPPSPQPPQPLDINGDGMPDLSCTASVTFDDGSANGEVECIDSNGEAVSVDDGICDLPKRDEDSTDDNDQADTEVCPEGSSAKYLAIKTSGDQNAWVKVEIDADRLVAKTKAWGYERCVGFPIEVGQMIGGATCPPPFGSPPTSPSEVTSQTDSSGNVILTWKDNSDNETGFKVYRDGELIGMTAADVTSYSDAHWPCGSPTVTYTVVATNEGLDSEEVTVVVKTEGDTCPPPPLPPSEVTSQIDSSGNVILTWKDNSDNETGFRVSRDGKLIETTAANVTDYSDTSLSHVASFTVTYEVVATNGGGDSEPAKIEVSKTITDYPDQVVVTWPDVSGEIGYNIYRDGQLIAQIPPNVTRYTDRSVTHGRTYFYEIKAVYNGDNEDVESLVKTDTATTPDEKPPVSRLFIEPDGSCTGNVTLTIDGLLETSCASTDCQTVTNQKGESVKNCAPNCSLAFDADDIGKEVTLTPHADPGCVSSSWGGHQDCVDGQVTMTTSKLCIAFFRRNDRLRPPEETRIPQGLCEGVAFDSKGKDQSTNALFEGRVLVNGVDVTTVKTTDQVDIQGYIRIDSQHLSLPADIVVSASHQATVQDSPSHWMVENDKFLPWDGDPAHLVPFRKVVLSSGELSVEIYHGTMPASGIVKLLLGYRLEDGTVVCSSRPIEFNVKK